jgi:hypothetical protein
VASFLNVTLRMIGTLIVEQLNIKRENVAGREENRADRRAKRDFAAFVD